MSLCFLSTFCISFFILPEPSDDNETNLIILYQSIYIRSSF
jgi:hypothetical protein